MAPRGGPGQDHLTHFAQLARSAESHHIFHALRVIEATYKDSPRLGESRRPREDQVRLGQEAELAFPPSTIRSFEPGEHGRPARLINRFFGLFGPHGPLPLHLTEYARDRQRNHRDTTLVAFANMLTHRLMSLFYRAWSAGQPAPSFDRGDNDPVERKVAAIAGYHGTNLRQRDEFPDLAKRHFAGLLSQGPKNAEGLVSILSAFFDAKVEVEEFVGSWLELEPDDRWELGGQSGLGQETSIGSQVWTRGAKFRLKIGPLSLEDYKRLLPGTPSQRRLAAIVRSYVGPALDWDVNLILRADEVPPAIVGESTQLGHVSWMDRGPRTEDASDLYLEADMMEISASAAPVGAAVQG
ncbi:MAG: type VI secretion system baseplate subunit TssG [Paracoccaceae bacterium]